MKTQLIQNGFKQHQEDSSIYTITENGTFARFLVSVDVFLAISNNTELLNHAKDILGKKYKVKDMGPVKNIFNWRVERTNTHIKISQPGLMKQLPE